MQRRYGWSHPVRSFQFHHAMAAPSFFRQQGSGQFPDIRGGHLGTSLSSGCRKLGIAPALRAETDIPPAVFHKPGRTQKRDRHWQIAECLLDDCVLREQALAYLACAPMEER